AAFKRAALWEVSFEPGRVHFQASNMAGRAELDDRPVVTRAAPALSFPTVAHVGRPSRHDQIVPVAEEHVAASEHHSAVFDGREIDIATNLPQAVPLRCYLAVHLQTRHPAIRKD